MKLNKFFLFMLILIYSLINISGNNSPIGIGESSNDSKRALGQQIDNYVILQFNQDLTYEGGTFLQEFCEFNEFYISYIMNGNETINPNTKFTVKKNTKLEVHFNQTFTNFYNFLDTDKDSRFASLISADFCNFDTSSVRHMDFMFYKCTSLETLYLSNFDTSKVESMTYLFHGCTSLKYLFISNFDFTITETEDYTKIFYDVNNLEYIDIYNIKGYQKIQDQLNGLNKAKLTVCQKNTIITGVINNCSKNIDVDDDILVCNNTPRTIPLIQTTIPQIQTTIPIMYSTIPIIHSTIPLIMNQLL